ncbi:pentapeptide repeat-containing protein [Methylocella sp.]|uniref:pentapeptide repeat-containing protein n=1 Tax=Methylocella sp. TaxID=1978226 RepID=UPI0037833883
MAEMPPEAAKKEPAAPDDGALDDARKSVEDAASVGGALWLSYLFSLFYIGLAAGGVTHRDLLLENPVRLPFLNVDLPLVSFFFLAPIIFVLAHAYALTHFVMLAGKIGAFDRALEKSDGAAEGQRRRLPSNIFAQFLAGPEDIRNGGLGHILRAVAWISLVFAPVGLLLFLQAQFLPYHLEWVTWVQRVAVLADVILLWALWPAVLAKRSALRWPPFGAHRLICLVAGVLSLGALAISGLVATFPGERIDEAIRENAWLRAPLAKAALRDADEIGQEKKGTIRRKLFAGEVDPISRRPQSLFYHSLVLIGFDALEAFKIDSDAKLGFVKQTASLRGRDLRGARFDFADLRKSDLVGAKLSEASFSSARLDLTKLDLAQMQGASLNQAHLEGASLIQARLQDAALIGAYLQGAKLYMAQLQGATLNFARFQGASFDSAQMQGASLFGAELQGASLKQAQLQGASLDSAHLQCTSLDFDAMDAASLQATKVWRTIFTEKTKQRIRIISPDAITSFGCEKWDILSGPAPKCATYGKSLSTALKLLDSIPEGDLKSQVAERLTQLKILVDTPLRLGVETTLEETTVAAWADRSESPLPASTLLDQWPAIACRDNEPRASPPYFGAPYAARALLGRLDDDAFKAETAAKGEFAEALLAEETCPGAKDLTATEKTKLKTLADAAKAAGGAPTAATPTGASPSPAPASQNPSPQ